MPRIQILTIICSILLLVFIARLILNGRLREEYVLIWVFSTLVLVVFSFWNDGIDIISTFLEVAVPSNLIFTAAIALILLYLLHLSVTVSKLQEQNKRLAQELATMKANEKSDKTN
jgi:hypothetical protein